MAASCLSMAATSSSSPSSSLLHPCNILSFDHFFCSPVSISAAHFPLKPKPKTLKLNNAQIPRFPLLSLSNRSTPRSSSAAFHSLEVEEDNKIAEVQEPVEPEDEGEREEEQKKPPQSRDASRLFVGNLPFSMTSSQLAEIFGQAGRVDSVEIVYDRVTNRSRGFAFVSMGSVEEAQAAIRMFEGSQIGGRTAKVNFPEVPRGGEREVMGPRMRNNSPGFIDSPHKIYAGNLSWSLTSQGLREAFAHQPGFMGARVIFERDSGRSRGFGFVCFESAEDVESALKAMSGVEIEGRPLRLNMAGERPAPAPPAPESTENGVDSSELLSSVSG
ncbi:33 kDa ribonucleoprotein, chloroplastic [Malania oleifera]|uniref:33 kDa ribonucleoprotein, chloroplastic n=1 Tax=Malania oleifera TaxID=397392 RepID=UPI0025ADE4EC|nr:33 kDa ribonucleoprotein, chloroplastic [Malania oleifera]